MEGGSVREGWKVGEKDVRGECECKCKGRRWECEV